MRLVLWVLKQGLPAAPRLRANPMTELSDRAACASGSWRASSRNGHEVKLRFPGCDELFRIRDVQFN